LRLNGVLSDGQKQSQRIIKSISKEGKTLKEKLKKYNASVQVLREHGLTFHILSWEQASDVTTEIYKQSSAVSPLQAWRRDAIEAYTLLQRAGEEINIIKSEMQSVILSTYNDCTSCDGAIGTMQTQSLTTIQAGLLSIAKARQAQHHLHLHFAVQSLSQYVDNIPSKISDYVVTVRPVSPPYESTEFQVEEDIAQPDEDEGFLDPSEFLQNDISKEYLFYELGSDSGLGTEC